MNQSKKLTEGAIFVGIYIVLMLVAFLPILSVFAGILLPIPFVIYTSRNGVKPALIMWMAAIILSSLFFTIVAMPFTILMGIAGIAIGYAIHKKSTAYETLGHGILGFIAGILLMISFYQVLFGVNFIQELHTVVTEQMETYLSFMDSLGVDSTGDADVDMETTLREQIGLLMKLVPALLALSAVLMAFLAQWMSYKIINRVEKRNLRFPPFRELKLPSSIIWLYLIAIIFSFINMDSTDMFSVGVQNALIILEMLLVIQGFSFIFFFAHHKKMSKAIPVISIILTFMFPFILLYFVRILGIIDIGLNLRDRMKGQQP